MAKLKVYRTPIGFHDAYVAASSQKAALAAWGTDRNQFAQGSAELVTDAARSRQPLASPGTVVKRPRGTAVEQIAALPSAPESSPRPKSGAQPAVRQTPRRRPDRLALDRAEAAVERITDTQQSARIAVENQIAALRTKLAELEKSQRVELAVAERARDAVEARYSAAMTRWPSSA